MLKGLSFPFIVKAQNFTERNLSKDLTLQRHALADVCNVYILINISENSQKSTCRCRPPAYSFVAKGPQRRCFPVNLRIFNNTFFIELFWAATSDFYIKVDKNMSNICDLMSTLKMVLHVERTLKTNIQKKLPNLRNLQGKYLQRSFAIVKPFFLRLTVILFHSNLDEKITSKK